MLLQDQRCLVTGGSRGLGRAICLALAAQGARVAFTYARRTDDAEQTRAQLAALGPQPLVFQGSVSDAAHATATVDSVLSAWGGLEVLVNCAAVHQILPLALVEEHDWDLVMDVNVKGAFLFSRAALKSMIRARRGHILNIGAFSSERIVEAPVHYAASKSALRGLTEAMAREMGKYGIQVNLLAPGLMSTGSSRNLPRHRVDEYLAQCPQGRLGTPEELAALAVFLVSPRNTFMSGAKVVADGGL
jgi:3-oxoacyl-[acyl-carrier protein] reductase